jgi:MoaA/NifB/PqqE/SkfB family radical SAM enzyme
MNQDTRNIRLLNDSLKIFFKDALKITLKNPSQAWAFLQTINWLRKSAKIRSMWRLGGVHVPPIVLFSITNQCNLECKGCYAQSFHPSSDEELSTEKLEAIIEEAKDLGVSFFIITGGEPFLRPEILEITKNFPEVVFLVFANGTLIDDGMIRRFRRQKNVVPLISLEGNAEHTDSRRGEGTYRSVHQIMGKMQRNHVFFGTSLTLTRLNYSTLTDDAYIHHFVQKGCRFFLFLDYTPAQEKTEDWVLTDTQRERVPSLIKNFRRKFPALFIGVPWDEFDVGGCLSSGRGFIHINARGDVEPCPFAPFSDTNLNELSLKEALRSEFLKKLRELPELSRYTGSGCALWKNREKVRMILEETGLEGP